MTPVARRLGPLLLVLVAACGHAPSPSAAKPTGQSNVTATIPAGTSGDYPPLSVWTGARPEGYGPALLDAFAASTKAEVAWTRFRWPDLSRDLAGGRFVVAADGITVRPERSVVGRFTVPIAWGGAVLLLRRPTWAEPSSRDVAALDRPQLRIAVNRGGHLERVTRGLFHAAQIEAIPDNAGVRAALAEGRVDAAMTNTFEAPRWAEGLPVERIGPLTHDVTALWVRADRADLAEQLDDWLLREEESGRLDALRRRLLGPGAGGPSASPVDALLAATLERLALMPFVAAAKQVGGKEVTDAAQEERVIAAALEAVEKAAGKHGVAPPSQARTEAFFRAQIEAAKDVQRRGGGSASPNFALDAELRPAIARISGRMAFLVVRLPHGLARGGVRDRARELLDGSGLDERRVGDLADAIAALGESR